jgi:hypothetical protein
MRSLTFTCPQTGRAIDAGVATDPHSLASVQVVMMHLKCPYCGTTHQFPVKSGYLAQPLYWPSMGVLRARVSKYGRQAET